MPKYTVAMVEDDPTILKINRTFLSELPDFSLAWEATSITAALENFNQKKPDLLLLDIYLPDNTGLFMLKHLKETEQTVPTIMITAADDASTVISLLDLGIFDYLIKPYLKERFIQSLTDFSKTHTCNGHFTQTEVDELFREKKGCRDQVGPLPKGLNRLTLSRVLSTLKDATEEFTAEDIAKLTGIAVVSVRRYLQFLIEIEKIRYRPVYGHQGRPIYRYSLIDDTL